MDLQNNFKPFLNDRIEPIFFKCVGGRIFLSSGDYF